jgi:hypothetical protein
MYQIDTDPQAMDQLRALPEEALLPYAELLNVLELVPWRGDSIAKNNPDGAVRTMPFGRRGMVTYLILEDQLRVDVLIVNWAE